MADIFFGKFSKLISKDDSLSYEEKPKSSEQGSTNQIMENKKPNQKILLYSSIILVGAILIFSFY